MITVTSIRSSDGGEGIKLAVTVHDAKKSYMISADAFLDSGIVKGEISEDDLEEIIAADKHYGAYRAAIRILSSGQCSAKRLYEKLRRRGFSHEDAKAASDEALEKGYIDEKWQIESYLRELVTKKHMGRRKIIPTLLAKGYSGEKIRTVLYENYTDADFAKAKKEFLMKKFGKTVPETHTEAEEMKKSLYKQGY